MNEFVKIAGVWCRILDKGQRSMIIKLPGFDPIWVEKRFVSGWKIA
jgi:predicted AlkP superfamily phosphohydrolase/phosphomutase